MFLTTDRFESGNKYRIHSVCLESQMAGDDPVEHFSTAVKGLIDRLLHTQSIMCAISSVHKGLYSDVRLPFSTL